MDAKIKSQYGNISISPVVIAKAAGLAACESFGVVGMAMVNFGNGLATLLTGDDLTKGVSVEIVDAPAVDNDIYNDRHANYGCYCIDRDDAVGRGHAEQRAQQCHGSASEHCHG